MMSKILLLVIIGSASAFVFENPCSKNLRTYKADGRQWYEEHIEEYANNGWNKWEAANKTRGATLHSIPYIVAAHEEIIGEDDKRYTVMVLYQTKGIEGYFYCYIFDQPKIEESYFMDCYEGYFDKFVNPKDAGQFRMFHYLHRTKVNACYN